MRSLQTCLVLVVVVILLFSSARAIIERTEASGSAVWKKENSEKAAKPDVKQQELAVDSDDEEDDEEEEEVDPEATKYFHEPGRDDILGHYDVRYFKKVVSYEERTHTLQHMIRAYLTFFESKGLETWIAHGTLLGWWWNGKLLPWDWDIDTQVSGATLAYMGKHYNQTAHTYKDPQTGRKRTYLLDVNSWAWERVNGDGMNIIDARWIDVHNGLYIDITGLSEIDPKKHPGVVSCKNFHQYNVTDIWPMRESVYEGVSAKIPFAYEKLLVDEYNRKALVVDQFEGHRWNNKTHDWEPDPILMKLNEQIKEAKRIKEEKQRQEEKERLAKAREERIKEKKLKKAQAKQHHATKPQPKETRDAAKVRQPQVVKQPEAANAPLPPRDPNAGLGQS